jgi:hypothetical protein
MKKIDRSSKISNLVKVSAVGRCCSYMLLCIPLHIRAEFYVIIFVTHVTASNWMEIPSTRLSK